MIGYHGTSVANAAHIAAGNVDVSRGGGELGRGFYTGQHIWVAKTWSTAIHGARKDNVVKFTIPDTEISLLTVERYDRPTATLFRNRIRLQNATRTFMFGCDMICSPIVGKEIVCDQQKWESSISQVLLNGGKVSRKVV